MESVTIAAADGYPLGATVFRAAGVARGAVVIAPAMAVRQGFYRRFAEYLAGRGLATLTFDYRGIGKSRPERMRGFAASLRQWAEQDLVAAVQWARAHLRPWVAALGHSAGGQILGFAAARAPVDAVVAVASQSGWYGHWDLPRRWWIYVVWHAVMPAVTRAVGHFPRWLGLGEDLPAGVALQWARWGRHPDYLLSDDAGVRARYAALRVPLLAFGIEDDPYAPPRAVEAFAGFYAGASVERRQVRPRDLDVKAIGHFGFFREGFQPTLWAPVADWLLERSPR